MFLAFNVLSKLGAADTALKAAKRIQARAPDTSLKAAKRIQARAPSHPTTASKPLNKLRVMKKKVSFFEILKKFHSLCDYIYNDKYIKYTVIIILFIYWSLVIIVNSPLMDYLYTPTVDTGLEFIGDGWWDVDFVREDGLRSCEERFANSNCLYGNDLSLWMSGGNGTAGYEEKINQHDKNNNLKKCSQGQIYQWDWWWAVDKDDPGPGNNYQYYCGDLDVLDVSGFDTYCSEKGLTFMTQTHKNIVYLFGLAPSKKTNSPRKYLECLYLNEKKCEPESGIRLPFVNLNESVTALGSSIADGFWGGLQAIGIVDDPPDNNATRMNRCMVQAGGINYRDTTKQAKNSIRYRIYKENNDDKNLLNQMEGNGCNDIDTLEEEIDSSSKGVCFGNFKPKCNINNTDYSIIYYQFLNFLYWLTIIILIIGFIYKSISFVIWYRSKYKDLSNFK